ncbi:MAG: hypothetical protein HOP19_14245 [Acidobacteria bacterium]|nr:hypothetical protein [Acidobacteriota bacterium]
MTESLLNEAATHVEAEQCGSTGIPNFVYGHGRLDIKAAYDLATATVELSATTINQRSGEIKVNVIAPAALKWRVAKRAEWLTLSGNSDFTGSATFTLRVAENTAAAARSGVIQIAGRSFTLTQAGSEPFAVSGRVFDGNGVPQPHVRIAFMREDGLEGEPPDVTTDAQGRWSQTGFTPGPVYRVIASRGRESFAPSAYTVSAPVTALNFIEVNRRIILPFFR